MKRLLIFFIFIFSGFLVHEAFAKTKKLHDAKAKSITEEYLLVANLTQKECEKLIAGECFRRDSMRGEPYYHQTRIVIFQGKIFAEQFFNIASSLENKLILQVKNGGYNLSSDKENLISFVVKNGFVSELKLLKGNLEKERTSNSKCDIAQTTYSFYQAYNKMEIVESSGFLKNEENFDGLKEFVLFFKKSAPEEKMILLKNSVGGFEAVENIVICKMPTEENFLIKLFSSQECRGKLEDNKMQQCAKYTDCIDYAVVKNCKLSLFN